MDNHGVEESVNRDDTNNITTGESGLTFIPGIEESRARRSKRRKRIWLSIIGVVCLLITFLAVCNFTDIIYGISDELTSASSGNNWSMFGRDLARTGSTGSSGIIPSGKIKWTFKAEGSIHSSPCIYNGTVYFGSQDHKVYAVDAETGKKKWVYETGSWVQSSPVAVDGVVYIGSNDSRLYALNAETGDKLWDFKARFAIRSTPAVANGMVYFGADDYYFYAVDTETGKAKWHFESDNYITSSPAVIGGIVYFGSMDDYVYAVNARNGKLRLKYRTAAAVVNSPVIVDGVIYQINSQGRMFAMDAGAKNWPLEEGVLRYWSVFYLWGMAPKPPMPSGYLWSELVRGHTGSSMTYSNGLLYVGLDNRLISIDTKIRMQSWQFETGASVTSSPAIEDGIIYFGSRDGYVYAVNESDGTEVWKVATGDEVSSSPAIDSGVVYIGSHDGKMYAFH